MQEPVRVSTVNQVQTDRVSGSGLRVYQYIPGSLSSSIGRDLGSLVQSLSSSRPLPVPFWDVACAMFEPLQMSGFIAVILAGFRRIRGFEGGILKMGGFPGSPTPLR